MIEYEKIKEIIDLLKECSAVALKFHKQKKLEISIKDDMEGERFHKAKAMEINKKQLS